MSATLDAEWERCSHWIADALQHSDGTHELGDVKAELDRRDALLWPGRRSALVTQICIYPRKRFLTFWLAGGDMGELVDEITPRVELFARAAKFDRLTIPGRKGWERVMRPHGYEPLWTIVGKALT